MENPELVVAVVALLGVVTGMFQLASNRWAAAADKERLFTQLKAEVISKQRQEWMDSIRHAAMALIAELDVAYGSAEVALPQERLNEIFLSSMQNATLIELKLNPEKPTQQAVIDTVDKLQRVVQGHLRRPAQDDDAQYHHARLEFKKALVRLFRETWLKIKALEA